MITETRSISNQNALYATGSDFCRIFKEDMASLYRLSLLLTADSEKAEQCFVAGLDDCAAGNQVFREWARSWARRTIIKNAIRLIAPEAANQDSQSATANAMRDQVRRELHTQFSALLDLQPFDRFVFVMSVLESYSDRECTLLLGCTRESLLAARNRALQQVAHGDRQPGANLKPEHLHTNRNSVVELPVLARLATTA